MLTASRASVPGFYYQCSSRYSITEKEHLSKVAALAKQCKVPATSGNESTPDAEQRQIVIKRKPSQSHCPRPHEYKKGAVQLDLSDFTKILSVRKVVDNGVGNNTTGNSTNGSNSSAISSSLNKDSSLMKGFPLSRIPASMRALYAQGEIVAVADVQAMASMENLVDALLPLGLMPAVVPEFKGITVGGSLQGLAAESSSFKYGFVHDCLCGFELLLADGRLVWCQDGSTESESIILSGEEEESDTLFHAVPGTFGSLGIATRAQILCVRAEPFVRVTARLHDSCRRASQYLSEAQDAELHNMQLALEDYDEVDSFAVNSVRELAHTQSKAEEDEKQERKLSDYDSGLQGQEKGNETAVKGEREQSKSSIKEALPFTASNPEKVSEAGSKSSKKRRVDSSLDFLEGIAYREDSVASIRGTFLSKEGLSDLRQTRRVRVKHVGGYGRPWFYNMIRGALRGIPTSRTPLNLFGLFSRRGKSYRERYGVKATEAVNDDGSISPGKIGFWDAIARQRAAEEERVIVMDTKSYLFRHDQGSFWMASYRIPQLVGRLMGTLLDSSNMFKVGRCKTMTLHNYLFLSCAFKCVCALLRLYAYMNS